MERQLNIRSDAACKMASDLARRTGRSRADIVLAALYDYAEKKQVVTLTKEQRAFADELRALVREVSKHKPPGLTSDHSDMYDEFGLPK